MDIRRISLGLVATGLILSSSFAIAQAPPANPPVRVRATIEKVDGSTLTLKLNDGQDATMKLGDTTRIAGLVKTTIDDVKPGNYVGVSSMPQTDGSLKAISIHIFTEAQRGVAEGHGPWDNRPGSMMTNANVGAKVTGNTGDMLTLTYKSGEQKVTVGPDAVIVKLAAGDKVELVPGAKIWALARKEPDGSLNALAIYVGRDGITPPM